jgi:hypothetical protein
MKPTRPCLRESAPAGGRPFCAAHSDLPPAWTRLHTHGPGLRRETGEGWDWEEGILSNRWVGLPEKKEKYQNKVLKENRYLLV